MAKPKPTPVTKYTYIIVTTTGGTSVLCKPGSGGQTIGKLWETGELTSFHDVELARATKEINEILSKLQRNNKDPERTLSFIEFQNRHLLVWATYGAVGPDDDAETIIKALKLKVR